MKGLKIRHEYWFWCYDWDCLLQDGGQLFFRGIHQRAFWVFCMEFLAISCFVFSGQFVNIFQFIFIQVMHSLHQIRYILQWISLKSFHNFFFLYTRIKVPDIRNFWFIICVLSRIFFLFWMFFLFRMYLLLGFFHVHVSIVDFFWCLFFWFWWLWFLSYVPLFF